MTLFRRADINPTILKLSSEAVQSDRPAMIGRRDRFTNTLDLSPIKKTIQKNEKEVSFYIQISGVFRVSETSIHTLEQVCYLREHGLIRVFGLLENMPFSSKNLPPKVKSIQV